MNVSGKNLLNIKFIHILRQSLLIYYSMIINYLKKSENTIKIMYLYFSNLNLFTVSTFFFFQKLITTIILQYKADRVFK